MLCALWKWYTLIYMYMIGSLCKSDTPPPHLGASGCEEHVHDWLPLHACHLRPVILSCIVPECRHQTPRYISARSQLPSLLFIRLLLLRLRRRRWGCKWYSPPPPSYVGNMYMLCALWKCNAVCLFALHCFLPLWNETVFACVCLWTQHETNERHPASAACGIPCMLAYFGCE